MEFWQALGGALVGGVATFAASWWQTGRILTHERDLAAQARDDEREAQRLAIGANVARDLLDPIGKVEHWAEAQSRSKRALDLRYVQWIDLGLLQHTHAALLGRDFAENWKAAYKMLSKVRNLFPSTFEKVVAKPTEDETAAAQAAAAAAWEYALAVKEQLIRVITDGEKPKRLEPPNVAPGSTSH